MCFDRNVISQKAFQTIQLRVHFCSCGQHDRKILHLALQIKAKIHKIVPEFMEYTFYIWLFK